MVGESLEEIENHAVVVYGRNRDRLLDDTATAISQGGGNIEQIVGQGYGSKEDGAGVIFVRFTCKSGAVEEITKLIEGVKAYGWKHWKISVDVPSHMRGILWRVHIRAPDRAWLTARIAECIRKQEDADGNTPCILSFVGETYLPPGSPREKAAIQALTVRAPMGLAKEQFAKALKELGQKKETEFAELEIDYVV